ncbi:Nucleotide-sugar uncharacterized transporter 2, partial [Durusdinium trenchii]
MLQLARVSLAFLCNFASGPATVMSNKMVFVTTGFSFPILLTVCHYVCTWLVIKAMSRLGVYSPAQAQLLSSKGSGARRSVILLIITWSFYNIMSNLSLSQNSVGIYQMIKLLMAPGAVVWDFVLYGKKPTPWQSMLLCLAVFGVYSCTVSSLDSGDLTLFGLAVAFLAVFLAIFQKGLTSHVIQYTEVKLSPLQLLDSCMPWMGAITVLSAIALEDCRAAAQQVRRGHCMAIAFSSLCGTMANVSSTWVLGLTSPLAHILLGQLKTILILLGGFLFFDKEPTLRTLMGAVMALTGITMYAWSKLPKEDEKDEDGATNDSVRNDVWKASGEKSEWDEEAAMFTK